MELITMTQFVLDNSKMRKERKKNKEYETVEQYLFDTLPVFLYANFISLPLDEEAFTYFENVSVMKFGDKGLVALKPHLGHPIQVIPNSTIEYLINESIYVNIRLNEKGIERLGVEI